MELLCLHYHANYSYFVIIALPWAKLWLLLPATSNLGIRTESLFPGWVRKSMSRILRKRKQNSADLAPVWWKSRLFTFTVASMQPPLLGLRVFRVTWINLEILKFLHQVPNFIFLALIFHETTLSKSPFIGTEKTLPKLVPSPNTPDPEKEVPLCLS